MMNQKKTRFGAWKMLAALPVAALLMVVGCKPAVTENPDTSVEAYASIHDMPADTTDTYLMVEAEPEFPGGMEALMKYLSENIKYPEQAKKENIQGKVYMRFVVERDGSIVDAEILRGIGGGCDEEALRVVNAMPKWEPGKQKGTPVRVQYNLPIVFKLQ